MSTAPVDLTKRVPKNAYVSGAALSLEARKAVVLVPDSRVGVKNPVTRVYLCNLATGTVRLEWEVKGWFAPLDLRADGAQVLTIRDDHGAHTQLDVWTITPDDELKRRTWQLHKPDPAGGDIIVAGGGRDLNEDVKWAAFAGPDRIVTASAGGQVRLWDAATLTRVGTIDGIPGFPL